MVSQENQLTSKNCVTCWQRNQISSVGDEWKTLQNENTLLEVDI